MPKQMAGIRFHSLCTRSAYLYFVPSGTFLGSVVHVPAWSREVPFKMSPVCQITLLGSAPSLIGRDSSSLLFCPQEILWLQWSIAQHTAEQRSFKCRFCAKVHERCQALPFVGRYISPLLLCLPELFWAGLFTAHQKQQNCGHSKYLQCAKATHFIDLLIIC